MFRDSNTSSKGVWKTRVMDDIWAKGYEKSRKNPTWMSQEVRINGQ